MAPHAPFIRLTKGKSAISSDLTVDSYPSPTEDVLPVFCLDKLQPAIYHPVLLTSTLLPGVGTSSASTPMNYRGSNRRGDNLTASSAIETASRITLHSGSGDETASHGDSLMGVPSPLQLDGHGSDGDDDSARCRGTSAEHRRASTASSHSEDSHDAATLAIKGRKRANSQLRMARGDSGKGIFAQACKNYVGKWEDAEWSDGPAVPRGEGIPGESTCASWIFASFQ